MKKYLAFFAFALFSLTTFAQNLDNEFYFRFGYSSASWKQFELSKEEWKDLGIENKIGGVFEIGTIFTVKNLPASENMAFGINVDYLYSSYNNFSSGKDAYNLNFGTLRLGSKIGPSFTYSPVDKLEFDVYAKADFAWATAAVIYEGNIEDADDYYRAKVAVGFSSGLNIRYGILMMGFEFNTISVELESDDYPGEYLQTSINEEFGKSSTSKKSSLPTMNFTIGLCF